MRANFCHFVASNKLKTRFLLYFAFIILAKSIYIWTNSYILVFGIMKHGHPSRRNTASSKHFGYWTKQRQIHVEMWQLSNQHIRKREICSKQLNLVPIIYNDNIAFTCMQKEIHSITNALVTSSGDIYYIYVCMNIGNRDWKWLKGISPRRRNEKTHSCCER